MKHKVQNKQKKVNNIKFPLFFILFIKQMITNIPLSSFRQTMSISKTISSFSFKPHLKFSQLFFSKFHSFCKEYFIITWRTDLFIILVTFLFKGKNKQDFFYADISASQKVSCLIYRQDCRYFSARLHISICRKQDHKSQKNIYIFAIDNMEESRLPKP